MSNNNNGGEVGAVAGMVVAGLACIAPVFFFLLAFLAFLMTVLALIALKRPLRLGRKFVIEPE